MNRKTLTAAVISTALVAATSAHAAVVAQYAFTSPDTTTANLSFANTATDPTATAGTLGVGSGLGAYFSTAGANSGTDTTDRAFGINLSKLATGVSGSKASNDYVTFTVTPAAGATTTFSTLTFTARARTSGATTSRTGSVFLTTDADAYGTTVNNTYRNFTATTTVTDTGYVSTSIDISGLTPITSARTFRVNLYQDAAGGNGDISLDSLAVNATSTPEPGTAVVAAGAMGGLLRRRRIR